MAGGKGPNYKNHYLTWALTTAAAPTRPTSWTVALYTDAAGLADGSAGPTTEATVGNCPGYARQSVSFGAVAATGGTLSNTTAATFTGTGAWAAVNYFAILDQAGNMVDWGPLATPRTLAVSGDKIDWAIGAIAVNEK
jgi:hypothetical protein